MKQTFKKLQARAIRTYIRIMTSAAAVHFLTVAAAAAGENQAPSGIGGSGTQQSMTGLVFWIVRIIILLVGGAPGLIKVVQGQSDENPRDRNAGIAVIGITGAAFGATFLVQNLI